MEFFLKSVAVDFKKNERVNGVAPFRANRPRPLLEVKIKVTSSTGVQPNRTSVAEGKTSLGRTVEFCKTRILRNSCYGPSFAKYTFCEAQNKKPEYKAFCFGRNSTLLEVKIKFTSPPRRLGLSVFAEYKAKTDRPIIEV